MTPPPLIHLVRHGEVHNPRHVNYADLPGFRLSAVGESQAAAAGRHLAQRPLAAVVASPLERAQQTAAAIAAPHGLGVATDDRLTEWRLAQVWAGVPWADIAPDELAAYREHPWELSFSPESLAELADRVAAAARAAHARHPDHDVAVVGHQDPVQAGRLLLTGRGFDGQHDDKPRHASVISLRPGEPWRELEHWSPLSLDCDVVDCRPCSGSPH